jgi:hypothetical protein
MWKENQVKIEDQVDFIKQILKHRRDEPHNIRILSKDEMYEIE